MTTQLQLINIIIINYYYYYYYYYYYKFLSGIRTGGPSNRAYVLDHIAMGIGELIIAVWK